MVETAILFLISGLCWLLVLSKSIRNRMPIPWWVKAQSISSEEQRNLTNVVLLVTALLLAVLLTLRTIVRMAVLFSKG